MNNRSSKSGCLRDIAREISDGYPDDRLLDTAITGSNELTIGYSDVSTIQTKSRWDVYDDESDCRYSIAKNLYY